MTFLAVPIFVRTAEQAAAAATRAAEAGAELIEYRLDGMAGRADEAETLVRRSPLPCIVTCRPAWEGGGFEASADERLAVLEGAAKGLPRYLDFEWAAWSGAATAGEARRRIGAIVARSESDDSRPSLILSSHDFQTRPADLTRRVSVMSDEPLCRVVKVVWRARSLRDNLEAFDLLAARRKPTIALCMGEYGLPSRVLAGKFGAMLTFASLNDESATAPGQVEIAALKGMYRWDTIGRATAVYGVIGWPVGHSMSPAIHNAGFDEVGHNGVYLPLPVPPEYEHFKATVLDWVHHAALGFRGASVTIPHKGNLLRLVREQGGTVEDAAERIGAANTLSVEPGGRLHASNTDCAAALDAVCYAMGIDAEGLRGKCVAVIGAGGAAAAVVGEFAGRGAKVTVYNRTVERAGELAERFNAPDGRSSEVTAAPLESLADGAFDILINCTPIGMHPKVDESPVRRWPNGLPPGTIVFDTVYNPIHTRLLREARERGLRTVSGLEMFVRQAAGQFTRWTGQSAPMDLFHRIVTDRLRP